MSPSNPPNILALADLATPMAIRVAATLGLVEKAGVGSTVDELAFHTDTFVPALQQLLAHLVTVGVFELDAETGRYFPTDLGRQIPDHALLLDQRNAGGRAELAFVELLGTVATGEAAYPKRYGQSFWDDLEEDSRLRASFDAQMNWRFRTQAAQIAERFDWSRYTTILDVGGGDGTLLTEIVRRHPGVRGRVLDLAPTARAAQLRFETEQLTDRASTVAGSFFDPIPAGAELYVLSDILHDWDDEHARKILAETAKAAGRNTVLIIESLRGVSAGTGIDLFMLMCYGSKERSIDELTAMASEYGLELSATYSVSDGRTALEFRRPTSSP